MEIALPPPVYSGAASVALSAVFQQNDPVRFSDATAKAKIDFKHENGSSPDKHLPETMSGGVVLFDFDNDDWLEYLLR